MHVDVTIIHAEDINKFTLLSGRTLAFFVKKKHLAPFVNSFWKCCYEDNIQNCQQQQQILRETGEKKTRPWNLSLEAIMFSFHTSPILPKRHTWKKSLNVIYLTLGVFFFTLIFDEFFRHGRKEIWSP